MESAAAETRVTPQILWREKKMNKEKLEKGKNLERRIGILKADL
jgi:hypothetical protein